MRTSLCWLAIAALACRGDKPASPPAAGSAGSAAPAADLAIFVDDAAAATVTAAQLADWPRVDRLVPPAAGRLGTWAMIALTTDQAKPTELARPSGSYPDMVPAVFPGDGGAPAFGMFDPAELARHGKPAMRADHVRALRIKLAVGSGRGQNDDGAASAGGDPRALVIAITAAAGSTRLTGDQLLALPREPIPGGAEQNGWRLQTLLEAAGVKAWTKVVLGGTGGSSLPIDKADLDGGAAVFVKLNKKGVLRVRVLRPAGSGWTTAGDLAGLAAIDVK